MSGQTFDLIFLFSVIHMFQLMLLFLKAPFLVLFFSHYTLIMTLKIFVGPYSSVIQSKRKLLHFCYLEWMKNDFQINTVYLGLLFKAHYQSNIQLKLIIRQLNESSNFKVIEILTDADAYSELIQTSKREFSAKVINRLKPVNYFFKKLHPGHNSELRMCLWLIT